MKLGADDPQKINGPDSSQTANRPGRVFSRKREAYCFGGVELSDAALAASDAACPAVCAAELAASAAEPAAEPAAEAALPAASAALVAAWPAY
jgi:hypothetical protein